MNIHRLTLPLIIAAWLFSLPTGMAQTIKGDELSNGGGGLSGGGGQTNDTADPCEDFKGGTIGNWGGINATLSIQQPGPTGSAGDFYLEVLDLVNTSFITNFVDYDGDWTTEGGCFCFDATEISTSDPGQPTNLKLQIFSGGLMAEFDFNQGTSVGQGWISVCAPIETCTGSTLPSNNFGQWQVIQGTNDCNTFNSIITNVTSIRIFVENETIPGEVNGFDNFCFRDCQPTSATCCARLPNLIFNGNFEAGNIGFTSDYDFNPTLSASSIEPGMFGIGNAAQALAVSPQWVLEDPSACEGLPNERVMLVNGRTQQTGSTFPWLQTGTEIWRQTVPIDGPGTYQFCGKFKNLPQPAFDIKPEVSFLVTNLTTDDFGPFTIDVGSAACDWEEISFQIEVTSNFVTALPIQIFVTHLGNGDGNDLAIDDLALHKLEEVPVPMYAGGATNGPGIEGSYGQSGSGDDGTIDASCDFLWRVTNVTGGFVMGVGNANFSTSGPPWPLTTTFPNLSFQPLTTYRIALELSNCDCRADNDNWVEVTLGTNGKVNVVNAGSSGTSGAVSPANLSDSASVVSNNCGWLSLST